MTDTALSDARQAAATEPSATEPATPLPATDKTAPAPGSEQDPPDEAKPADAPKPPDPKDLAIRRLAFEQRETKRKLKEAQDRLAVAQPKDPNAPLTRADIDRHIEERAQAIIAEREQKATNEAWVAKGAAEYSDFNARCNVLADLGAGENPAFMAAIGKLPTGHKVIAELADDPAEVTRILELSPVELGMEIASISARISAADAPDPAPPPPVVVTAAPPPIKPLATRARADVRPEDMSSEQYMAWWNKRTRG